jgi:uncharacterized repeat protein (TIGR03803 family)
MHSSMPWVVLTLPWRRDVAPPCDGRLIADRSGNLYGTTQIGGASGKGAVFKLTGTGFVPGTPFAAVGAKLVIQFGKTLNHDFFEMGSSFTLGSASRLTPPPVYLSVRANVRNVPPLFAPARVILGPARRRPVRQVAVFRHPPAHWARLVVLIPWEAVGG